MSFSSLNNRSYKLYHIKKGVNRQLHKKIKLEKKLPFPLCTIIQTENAINESLLINFHLTRHETIKINTT